MKYVQERHVAGELATQAIFACVVAHSTEALICMLRYQQKTGERYKAYYFILLHCAPEHNLFSPHRYFFDSLRVLNIPDSGIVLVHSSDRMRKTFIMKNNS